MAARLNEVEAKAMEERTAIEEKLAQVSAELDAQSKEMDSQALQHREDVASHRTNYWVHAVKVSFYIDCHVRSVLEYILIHDDPRS